MIRTRHAALVLAAVATALLAAGCGSIPRPATSAAQRSTAPAVAPSPAPAATPLPTPAAVADPAAVVRETVTAGDPRLLPSYVPSGMTPALLASASSFAVDYADDQHTRSIHLSLNEGANPPPARTISNPNGTGTSITFRGVSTSYVVYDTTAPLSQRYLMWQEPGTWARPVYGMPGEYFLSAAGLTEPEFYRVADSLQPVR
jgi:hypothetical protein